MNQESIPKSNFFQIIKISTIKLNDFVKVIYNNKIELQSLYQKDNSSFILINVIEKLGRILRNNTDYEFYTFSNEEFKKILKIGISKNFAIDNIDFLRYPFYEDEKEIEKVENIFFSGKINEIINFINIEKIEINKIAFSHDSLQLTVYRTGLIWFTNNITELRDILKEILSD
jgi:hypothetical protein